MVVEARQATSEAVANEESSRRELEEALDRLEQRETAGSGDSGAESSSKVDAKSLELLNVGGAMNLELGSAMELSEAEVAEAAEGDLRWEPYFRNETSKRIAAWNDLVLTLQEEMSQEGSGSILGLKSTPRIGSSKWPYRRAFLCEKVQHALLTEHANSIQDNRTRRTECTGKAEYRTMLQKARSEALDSSEFVDVSGLDRHSRPVVTIPVANLDRSASDLQMVLRSMVLFLDSVVEVDYVLVLFLTERDGGSTPGLSILQEFHKMLPRSYKKHMKEIYLIHASWQSKVYLNLIRPFVSNKVFKKVVHAEKLEQLYDHIDQTEILVPPFVQEADDAMD